MGITELKSALINELDRQSREDPGLPYVGDWDRDDQNLTVCLAGWFDIDKLARVISDLAK